MEAHDSVSAILRQKSGEIWSVAPDATVYAALEIMSDKEVGALIVMVGGKMVGLLSERDYARKVILKGRSSKDTKVAEIMDASPTTVLWDCAVSEAMRIMTEQRVRHLPVIGSNWALKGVVSIGDLLKWIAYSQEKTIEQLHSYIAGHS